MCLVALIKEHLKRNKLLQDYTSINSCFVTYGKPSGVAHKENMAMALCTENIMVESGVDTKIFKPHSSRSTSISTAAHVGVTR